MSCLLSCRLFCLLFCWFFIGFIGLVSPVGSARVAGFVIYLLETGYRCTDLHSLYTFPTAPLCLSPLYLLTLPRLLFTNFALTYDNIQIWHFVRLWLRRLWRRRRNTTNGTTATTTTICEDMFLCLTTKMPRTRDSLSLNSSKRSSNSLPRPQWHPRSRGWLLPSCSFVWPWLCSCASSTESRSLRVYPGWRMLVTSCSCYLLSPSSGHTLFSKWSSTPSRRPPSLAMTPSTSTITRISSRPNVGAEKFDRVMDGRGEERR